MNRRTRVRLDTVNRVYVFSQAHQATIAGYVEAVKQMGDLLARANTLAVQVESGERAAEASAARKEDTRRIIQDEHLAHLVRIARVSLPNDPELRRRFRLPKRAANQQKFVATVRAILEEAERYRDLFIKEGMAETFLADLQAQLTAYLATDDQKSLSALSKVGAGADLKAVTAQLMKLIRRLDGINRKRWQNDSELLAAWISAKDVGSPRVVTTPAATPAPTAAKPGTESVA
jgi:hypothetical protein